MIRTELLFPTAPGCWYIVPMPLSAGRATQPGGTPDGGGGGPFPFRPMLMIRCSFARSPAMSRAFLTPLAMFFEIFHAPTASEMMRANLVIDWAALAVPATAPAPKETNDAAIAITAVTASSIAKSSRMRTRGLRRHGRRGTLVAGRGVVLGHCVVVSGLHHYAAVVLQCLGQIVDRAQHFLDPLVVRGRPRLARIVGAGHGPGSAENVDVHVERVVELAGLLEQARADGVERLGVDVLDGHDSICTFSRAALV